MPERGREPIAVVATIERYELCCLMQESGCGLVAVVERSETRDCRFAYRRGIPCSMELGGVWA